MVEVEADLVRLAGEGGDGLLAGVLQLRDQVVVLHAREALALLGVEVHVVDPQGAVGEGIGRVRSGLDGHRRAGDAVAGGVERDEAAVERVEGDVDLDLVELQGDERQREPRVLAEPELQRDVVRAAEQAVVAQADVRRVLADHLVVPRALLRLGGQLVPDLEPRAVVLVDLLPADLDGDGADQRVADRVDPRDAGDVAVRFGGHRELLPPVLQVRQVDLEEHRADEVARARDRARHLASEARRAVEHLLDALDREVGVPPVDELEEGDLRRPSQDQVLGAVGDELHQPARHFFGLFFFFFFFFNKGLQKKK